MAVFNKVRSFLSKKGANVSFSEFERAFYEYFYGGLKSKTGVLVTADTALRFSAVYACVRVIAEALAVMPIKIYRERKGNTGRDLVKDHPLYDLLHNAPNGEMTAFAFKETAQSHILLSGNAYAVKELDGRGRVKSLRLLNWSKVTPQRNKETGKIEYEFEKEKEKIILSFDDVFHIAGLGSDGIIGYSPIQQAMEAVGLGIAAERFASMFFANGANIGGFIELPGVIKDKDKLRAEFKEKYEGLGKAHKIMFLEEGMKFQKIMMPLDQAQFMESRKFQIQEIARIYRVPLHLIQDLEKATFSNIEHQDLGFIKHSMLPWVVRWEQAINTKLLTKSERQQGYYAEFSMDALLRGDAKSRADVLHIKRQDGIISANEWRELDNQNPQEGEFGDKYFINSTMVPVDIAAQPRAQTSLPAVIPEEGGGQNGQNQIENDVSTGV